MIDIFKTLFGKKKEKEYIPDPPGRTFNKILTGKYFSCEDINAVESLHIKAKKKKIAQINELGLLPMFVRYSFKDTNGTEMQLNEDHPLAHASSAHVVFQKEVSTQRGQMTHVTEISFTVNRSRGISKNLKKWQMLVFREWTVSEI